MRERQVEARWTSWSGDSTEILTLGWENGGWTADGFVSGIDVHYVVRVDAEWCLRQFMLFRDLDEPDLWLACGPDGRWGEVNGAKRPDLDGCTDVDLLCTPFTNTLPIRRLGLDVGSSADIVVAYIDPESLLVEPSPQRYARTGERRWRFEAIGGEFVAELDVDEHGLVGDYPDLFRRTR